MQHFRGGPPGILKRMFASAGQVLLSFSRSAKTHGADRSNAHLTALTLGRSERTRDRKPGD